MNNCSRCRGNDPNCYVCWEEPAEERDAYQEAADRELVEEFNQVTP
jgi:hypothetical protein